MTTISIVTASYEQGEFLEECIRSVAEQSIEADVEHLVVDGGSEDETVEVIRRNEDHIDWWCSEPDDGPAAALNKGVRRSTGDLIGCLNADDFYCSSALERIEGVFRAEPGTDVVYGHGLMVDRDGQLMCRIYSDQWDLERALYGRCPVVQQGTFYRREALERAGGFNEANRTCWDFELLVDLALTGAEFRRVDALLGAFRMYSESITGSGLGEAHRRDHQRIRERVLGVRPRAVVELKRKWLGLQRLLGEPGLAALRLIARFKRWRHRRQQGTRG